MCVFRTLLCVLRALLRVLFSADRSILGQILARALFGVNTTI